MKPKHKRLIIIFLSLTSIFIGVFVLLSNFKDNLIYFYPPKDIYQIKSQKPEKFAKMLKKQIRVGGMIKQGSYKKTDELNHIFVITDFDSDIEITYKGILPPMFREGQGIVAQGFLADSGFSAKTLITKHDEKYMPPEIGRLKPAKR